MAANLKLICQLKHFINQSGESFDVALYEAPVPIAANYWGFYIIASHATWKYMKFFVIMMKERFSAQETAIEFIKQSPISPLSFTIQQLEQATQNGADLSVSGTLHMGWDVITMA